VAAATLTDVHSAVTGAIGALKGPLHGGANTDVMNLLLEIGQDATDQKVEEIIRAKLARKEKIPGFGHRVYRTEDPRATHLRRLSEELCTRTATGVLCLEISCKDRASCEGRSAVQRQRRFHSATTYYALGIPLTCLLVFAVSRSPWTAHVLEQYANNRLIRPRPNIGPAPAAVGRSMTIMTGLTLRSLRPTLPKKGSDPLKHGSSAST
jgi:citrate synthase